MNSILKELYYNPKSPSCYSGVQRLYKEAKKKIKTIKLDDVKNFLASQDTHTLHAPYRRKFKRNKLITCGIDCHWMADLADMSALKSYNDNNRFLLVCVDVLSRFIFVRPLKRKTPLLVSEALNDIIETSGRQPWFLVSDRGIGIGMGMAGMAAAIPKISMVWHCHT